MTGNLDLLVDGLRQARRELAWRAAAQLASEPERSLPDMGLVRELADLQGAIAAAEAVAEE